MATPELRRRIGRLLFIGIPGPQLDDATRGMLQTLEVGGVVLFRRNLGAPGDIRNLTAALHALPSHPLVAIDHEGGRVTRVGEPFTPFPAAAAVGRTRDPHVAFRVGKAMATELASVGIDVSFAPVLDVHSNPANPIIGDRAFGSDPGLVSNMGIALMRGLLDGGVIPCGKHFPGHGDTEKDSHVELPLVRRTRAELERIELPPFRAAIAAGAPMLMTAHVLYPALDPESPATLSRRILTDLLRSELGFSGVVASDDLEMRAIADHRSIGAAAITSLSAGADVLLICENLTKAIEAQRAIEKAVDDLLLPSAVIDAASDRVERLHTRRAALRATACHLPNAEHRMLLRQLAGA